MISIQLHYAKTAEAFENEAGAGVTIRFADDSRVTLHLRMFEQAAAIADAINRPASARVAGRMGWPAGEPQPTAPDPGTEKVA